MKKQLYPYQFNYIKEHVAHLINVYNSVNDLNTITSIQEATREQILNTFQKVDSHIQLEVEKLMNYQLSKMQAEKILSTLQGYVFNFFTFLKTLSTCFLEGCSKGKT